MQQGTSDRDQKKVEILVALDQYIKQNQLTSTQIIKKFDKNQTNTLNMNSFHDMIKTVNPDFPSDLIYELFGDCIRKFKVVQINWYVIDQLCKGIAKQRFPPKKENQRYEQQPQQQPQQSQDKDSTPQELCILLNKTINQQNISLKQLFILFDRDKDDYLSEKELQILLKYFIPTLSQQELQATITHIASNKEPVLVSKYQFMKVIQNDSSMLNSQRFYKPAQDNLPPKQKPNIKFQESPVKKKKPEDMFKPRMSPILYSNVYEDPKMENVLSSKDQFEEFVRLEEFIPGLKEFLMLYIKLKNQNQQFSDHEFPPNSQSLGNQLQQHNYSWKKPIEVYGEGYSVFVKDIETSRVGLGKWISQNDICQGELGDCYFLSSLSSLACRWPDVVKDLFITQTINQVGMYCVRLCLDGEWKCIQIDDFFPAKGRSFAFTQSKSKEIWPMIFEKCWAKIFKSYSNIIAGQSSEVFKALTGGPTWSLETDDKNFRDKFEGYIQRKCILTTGTYKKGENGNYSFSVDKTGLVPGHAYSILKMRKVEHPQRGKIILVKLRNPWGEKEWRGDWCDDSPLWTERIREKCNYNKEASNDGVFFMELDDMVKYFSNIQIGYFNTKFIYQSQSFASDKKHGLYFMLNIKEDGEYFVSAHQENARHYKNTTNFQYSPIKMLLARKLGNDYELVQAKHEQSSSICVGELLEAGQYVLYVKINWLFWDQKDFVVSVYGEQKAKLNIIQKVPDLIQKVYINEGKKNDKKKEYGAQITRCHEIRIDEGFGYIYFENNSNRALQSKVQMTQMNGLKLRKPDRSNQINVNLASKDNKIAIFKVDVQQFDFGMSESYTIK